MQATSKARSFGQWNVADCKYGMLDHEYQILGKMRRTSMGKQLRVRCWIDIDGERFFGPGRAELLQLIIDTGSISKAAKAMGMSYKKAWAMIEGLNTQARRPYVIAHKGGQSGGGTVVTARGRAMLLAYQKLSDKIHATTDKHIDILKLI